MTGDYFNVFFLLLQLLLIIPIITLRSVKRLKRSRFYSNAKKINLKKTKKKKTLKRHDLLSDYPHHNDTIMVWIDINIISNLAQLNSIRPKYIISLHTNRSHTMYVFKIMGDEKLALTFGQFIPKLTFRKTFFFYFFLNMRQYNHCYTICNLTLALLFMWTPLTFVKETLFPFYYIQSGHTETD